MAPEEYSEDLLDIDPEDLEAAASFYDYIFTEEYQNQTFKLNQSEEIINEAV